MKIVNYDAPERLATKVVSLCIPDFVLDVVRPLERVYNHFSHHQLICDARPHSNNRLPLSPIWKFEGPNYSNVAALIHTIPIYLRDSGSNNEDEKGIVDPLGAYFSNLKGDSPYIELYLSQIDNSPAVKNDDNFKWLFTKVLIHELGHASLDIFNLEHNQLQIEKEPYKNFNRDFGKCREESMANAIALRIIKDYGNRDFYNFSKDFMSSQSPEYALGILMEGFGYWDFRSVFDSKKLGVNSDIKSLWLDYALDGSPNWAGLHEWNERINSQYVYIFDGKYYTREEYLVIDILKKVLTDYKTKNGSDMPESTFTDLFPRIQTGAELAYEQGVINSSRYHPFIKLQNDVIYSLYYFWNNKTLKEFIAKLIGNGDVILTEYQNW